MDPAVHDSHEALPASLVYSPAPQFLQLSTADVLENIPAAHAVHVLAPAAEPVLVMEPTAHMKHKS
jgi:hypothetical protein